MVFQWHARPGAFERLTPPWEAVRIVARSGGISDGAQVVLRLRLGPWQVPWVAEHCDYIEAQQFRDVQLQGPFARWEHTHRFVADGPAACYLEDRLVYALPFGLCGRLAGGGLTRRKLQRLFAYRHRITRHDIACYATSKGADSMHVLVSGASGLVGSALVPFLTAGGHQVSHLVRRPSPASAADIPWDPATRTIGTPALEGLDAVVHLAGENIATGRWTAAKKARIYVSRVEGTRLLCEALAQLVHPPKVLICASAIGYYGDRGARVLRETSAPGDGFLAEVCQAWEAATSPAVERGIRVVFLRLGMVLSRAGGALAQLLRPFQLGLGGVLGPGTQYMSWIAIDDVLGAIQHILHTDTLRGPVNAVAPQAVTNRDFTSTLGTVLKRPTLVPMPAFAARLLFGEMADALLLASTRVEPARLQATGFTFAYPELAGALRHLLGVAAPPQLAAA